MFSLITPSCKAIRALIILKGEPGGYSAKRPRSNNGLLMLFAFVLVDIWCVSRQVADHSSVFLKTTFTHDDRV